MSVRSPLPLVLIAAFVTFVAYLAVTPLFAFGALLNAAAANDDVVLARQVDYPAVRASLADQTRAATSDAVRAAPAPVARIADVLSAGLSAAVAEAIVTPEGLRELLGVGRLSALDVREIRELHDRSVRRYRSWDTFAVTARSPLIGGDVTYVFERRWFGWRLTGVEL